MRTLDAAAVRAATPWPELIAAIGAALVEGAVAAPERHVHPVGLPDGGTGSLLLMPAWLDGDVHPVGLPDGDEMTARRTAAVSALAADRLARTDAARLLVVGTGVLSPNMARAHAAVRPLTGIEIWGRRAEAAQSVAETLRAECLPAEASDDLDASICRADIVPT